MLDEYAKQYSSPLRAWLGPMLCVYISDAENAELVLKSKDCVNRPRFFRKIMNDTFKCDGLLSIESN